jgi:hypothetical protein
MTCARRGNTCCRRRAAKHRLLSSSRRNAQRALVRAFGYESTWLELVNYHSGDADAPQLRPQTLAEFHLPGRRRHHDGDRRWRVATRSIRETSVRALDGFERGALPAADLRTTAARKGIAAVSTN